MIVILIKCLGVCRVDSKITGSGVTVVAKVCDTGLARDIYPDEYYVPPGMSKAVPVRWAAPEVLHGHKTTIQSDVVSLRLNLIYRTYMTNP